MPAGLARLEVTFRVDADGLLTVHAREPTTGIEAEVTVKPSYGLDDEEVEQHAPRRARSRRGRPRGAAPRRESRGSGRIVQATQKALPRRPRPSRRGRIARGSSGQSARSSRRREANIITWRCIDLISTRGNDAASRRRRRPRRAPSRCAISAPSRTTARTTSRRELLCCSGWSMQHGRYPGMSGGHDMQRPAARRLSGARRAPAGHARRAR